MTTSNKDKFNEIVNRIRAANEGKMISRIKRKSIQVLGTIEISHGKVDYQYVSLVKVDESYILLQYDKGKFPPQRDLHMQYDFGIGRGNKWNKIVSDLDVHIIQECMDMWNKHKCSSLRGYTWLISYCLAKGLDLVKNGWFEN